MWISSFTLFVLQWGSRSITKSKIPALHEVEKLNDASHRFYSLTAFLFQAINGFSWLNNHCRLSEDMSGCRSSRPAPSSFKSNWLCCPPELAPLLLRHHLTRVNHLIQLTPGAMQLGVALQGSLNRSFFHLLLFELYRWYTWVNFYRHGAQSGIQGDLPLTVPAISNPCDLPGMRHRYGGDLLKELQGRKIGIPLVIVLESNYVAFWIDNLIFFGCGSEL